MVYIISGKKDSGKTTRMEELFRNTKNAAGFISKKIVQDGLVTGYDIIELSSGHRVRFARVKGYEPEAWHERTQIGKFSFSKEGLRAAEGIIHNALEAENSGISTKSIFLDEIGKLELKGDGFCKLLTQLLKKEYLDIYIAVRSGNIKSVLRNFAITDYRIL